MTKVLNPRQALNKAFLKVKPIRSEIEVFKSNLSVLINQIKQAQNESEEFHKNIVSDFLKKTYYNPNYFINTKGRNDLVIHNGAHSTSSVGVVIEAKKPTNKTEMITKDNINKKAFQELVLYYLRERVTGKNLEIRHLIATNINEWFVFDATLFDKLFAQNKKMVEQFNDFESKRLSGNTTEFFYKNIAEPHVVEVLADIEFTYFNLQDFNEAVINVDNADDFSLIALFKLFSPEHLLKLPFANDSNSLDKRFYGELLHIIGLEEIKEGGKKIIGRRKEGERYSGTLIEDAIIQLDTLDRLSRMDKLERFGSTTQERLFSIALELAIIWINRILFLKLLEAQLITYHKEDSTYAFLKIEKIKDYDDLNSLFFQVLARKHNERNDDVKKAFEQVPYLNSSLFEPTDIEHTTLFISNLRDDKSIPIYAQTVLKDQQGKKRVGSMSTLEYLFEFLGAYDFSSEGSEAIQEDNKTLINASVLGLIFEKINGYKDGSFFTPSFITMYMCRETIRKAVVQKFNEVKKWSYTTFDELDDKIEDRKEANEIINSLKICDPAVGSGHFLVSALNEIIAIKSELRVLLDRAGKSLKDYHIEVSNDELIVMDKDDGGRFFEYNPKNKESQRVQEALFHEKQTIIEKCLFGVDINPNSVKICRLRLWIELLKSAYYKNELELETLPNIDINIKCGNSLVSRFALDVDLKKAFKKSGYSIESYRNAVATYQNAESKEQKREMERLITDIKADFRSEISKNDPLVFRKRKLDNELYELSNQQQLFEPSKKENADRIKRIKQLGEAVEKLALEIEAIKSNKIFENAFEWRFEFPEVLDDKGDFVGFDVVIGNPPYGIKTNDLERDYFNRCYYAFDDIYTLFMELSTKIMKLNSDTSFITPITWLTGDKYKNTRSLFVNENSITKAINLPYNIFADAFVDTGIYFFKKSCVDESLVFEFNPKQRVKLEDLETIVFGKIKKLDWYKTTSLKINLNLSENSIFSKIDSIGTVLDSFSETARGILADKALYTNDFSEDKKKVFVGNLNRYVIDNSFNYIKYDENIKEKPRSYKFFKGERVLIRRIINRQFRMMATLVVDEFVCKKDIYVVKLNDSSLSYKYILALLNSRLFSYYKTKNSGAAKKDDFTQITLSDLRQIPIKKIDLADQKPFIDAVDLIMERLKLGQDIKDLDEKLDQLIYELYGLTEDEIKIVEGSSNH